MSGAFVIMPNRFHAAILLNDNGRDGSIGITPLPEMIISSKLYLPADLQTRAYGAIKRHPLSEIVRAFKSFSARWINVIRKTTRVPVWQRNYYEHMVSNSDEHNQIQFYI